MEQNLFIKCPSKWRLKQLNKILMPKVFCFYSFPYFLFLFSYHIIFSIIQIFVIILIIMYFFLYFNVISVLQSFVVQLLHYVLHVLTEFIQYFNKSRVRANHKKCKNKMLDSLPPCSLQYLEY